MNVFDDDVAYPALHVVASILAWASSVINPFIYAASNRQYRSAYSKLFRKFQSAVTVSKSGPGSTDFRAMEKNGQQFTSKANLDLS